MINYLKDCLKSTPIGMLPDIINHNNEAINDEFSWIFDSSLNRLTKSVYAPTGSVKSHFGEFVNLACEYITIKNPDSIAPSIRLQVNKIIEQGLSHNGTAKRFQSLHLEDLFKNAYAHDAGNIVYDDNNSLKEKIQILDVTATYFGGKNVTVKDQYINAEGYVYNPSNDSFATGKDTSARSSYARADGVNTIASGIASHAEGNGFTTIASCRIMDINDIDQTYFGDGVKDMLEKNGFLYLTVDANKIPYDHSSLQNAAKGQLYNGDTYICEVFFVSLIMKGNNPNNYSFAVFLKTNKKLDLQPKPTTYVIKYGRPTASNNSAHAAGIGVTAAGVASRAVGRRSFATSSATSGFAGGEGTMAAGSFCFSYGQGSYFAVNKNGATTTMDKPTQYVDPITGKTTLYKYVLNNYNFNNTSLHYKIFSGSVLMLLDSNFNEIFLIVDSIVEDAGSCYILSKQNIAAKMHNLNIFFISTGIAAGYNSIALGHTVQALGVCSFASGLRTVADGFGSISMGEDTYSSGECSFTSGIGTVALESGLLSIGTYNTKTEDILFAVGNGEENKRSDALSLDVSGNMKISGNLEFSTGDPTIHSISELIEYVKDLSEKLEEANRRLKELSGEK